MKKRQDPEKIFDAAIAVFAKYGFKKATLDDIALELGMTKSNLYHYVKDKENLYEQAVAHGMLKWQRLVAEAVTKEKDVVAQFKCLCSTAFQYLARDVEMRTILVNDPSIFSISPKEDRFKSINNTSITMLKNIITKGIEENKFRSVDVGHTSEFLFSVYVMFIIKTYVKSEGSSTEILFTEALDLFIHGLIIT